MSVVISPKLVLSMALFFGGWVPAIPDLAPTRTSSTKKCPGEGKVEAEKLAKVRLARWTSAANRDVVFTSLKDALERHHGKSVLVISSMMDCPPCWEESLLMGLVKEHYAGKLGVIGLMFHSGIEGKERDMRFAVRERARNGVETYGRFGVRGSKIPESYFVLGAPTELDVWLALGGSKDVPAGVPKIMILSPARQVVAAWNGTIMGDFKTLQNFLGTLERCVE